MRAVPARGFLFACFLADLSAAALGVTRRNAIEGRLQATTCAPVAHALRWKTDVRPTHEFLAAIDRNRPANLLEGQTDP